MFNTRFLAEQFQRWNGRVYADWTGGGQAPASLMREHAEFLIEHPLGNPHSHHAPSARAMGLVDQARIDVLDYFNADPLVYEVIFTPNASAAILLLQHYMWEGGELVLTASNHNTVNGLREVARRNGAGVRYTQLNDDLSLDREHVERAIKFPRRSGGNRLFAYPAKSNYSGTLHPLELVTLAQEHGMDVLLDVAAFVANKQLDLSRVQPEFVPISFYKMFGYPTGLGCLIVKREALKRLHKKWFSGGSIVLASVLKDFFIPEVVPHARFEDGTVAYDKIPAVSMGLKWLKRIDPDGDKRHAHAEWIARTLRHQLAGVETHDARVVTHSPEGVDTVTFSIVHQGEIVDAWVFEKFATERGVDVRTGCFCNPGENETLFGYDVSAYDGLFNAATDLEQVTLEGLKQHSGGKPIGSTRASFGYMSEESYPRRFTDVVDEFVHSLRNT